MGKGGGSRHRKDIYLDEITNALKEQFIGTCHYFLHYLYGIDQR
jgi:hypothetical protein